MLNFLTQNIKNKVINEYSLRIVVVLLIMVFIVCVFLISLFLPSFFMSIYKNSAVDDQYKMMLSNTKEDSINSIEIVKENNSLISVLSSGTQNISTSTSEFIEKIFLLKNQNIKISSISVSNKTNEVKIIIGGISKTRDGLTLFNKALKNSHYFDEIILPVVNLLKSTDIEFSITLIYKQK
ncbi:MAG: hypothetical protein NTU76_00555 [Candidatus Taylorbacteria bacterium]|nr:hypothetical protein [Candidatus Taylorbacteria bacterium]